MLVIAAAVLLVRFLLAGEGQPIFYLRENRLFYLSRPEADPVVLTDETAGALVTVTEDGKYAYLVASDGWDTALYRVELGRLGSSAARNQSYIQRLDSEIAGVDAYLEYGRVDALPASTDALSVSADGGTVCYLQGTDGALRRFDGSQSVTLAEGVSAFQADESGQRLLMWMDNAAGGTALALYTQEGIQTLAEDVASLAYCSEDLEEICYTVWDDAVIHLYAWDAAGGSERLAAETAGIPWCEGRDSFAYLTYENNDRYLIDFVEDDMAAQDAALTEPRIEDFQTTETYTDFFGDSRERTTTDYDAYWEARDAYREKEQRDNLRRQLEEELYASGTCSLYVRQGGTDTLISDRIIAGNDNGLYYADHGVFVYVRQAADPGEQTRIPLSRITSTWDVYEALGANRRTVSAIADVTGERATLDGPVYQGMRTDSGDIYLLHEESHVLTRCTQAGDLQVIAEDVSGLLWAEGDGKAYYSVPGAGGRMELYCWDGASASRLDANLDFSELYVYDDGFLVSLDAQGGAQLRCRAASGDWSDCGEGLLDWCRLEGDQLVLLSDDGVLYTFDGRERTVIANNVSGFCCPGALPSLGVLQGVAF